MKDMTDVTVVGFKNYRIRSITKAIQIKTSFKIESSDDTYIGQANDWLCEDENGKRFIIDNFHFRTNYELAEEPNEYEIKCQR